MIDLNLRRQNIELFRFPLQTDPRSVSAACSPSTDRPESPSWPAPRSTMRRIATPRSRNSPICLRDTTLSRGCTMPRRHRRPRARTRPLTATLQNQKTRMRLPMLERGSRSFG